jgi:hypothetical protein
MLRRFPGQLPALILPEFVELSFMSDYNFHTMVPISHLAVHGITGIFVLGCIGAVITIPIVAYRFVAVLFEHDAEEEPGTTPDKAA